MARTLGNQGRFVIRTIDHRGNEGPLQDVLVNTNSSGAQFDTEWEHHASAIGTHDYWYDSYN